METFDFAEAYTSAPASVVVPSGRSNTLEALEVVPSGRAVGAEIQGVDLAKPVPAELADALRQAWADHLVLLFRDQKIEPDNYVYAAQIF